MSDSKGKLHSLGFSTPDHWLYCITLEAVEVQEKADVFQSEMLQDSGNNNLGLC